MDSDTLEASTDPALELSFASEWLLEAEPDPSGWLAAELPEDPEASAFCEYGVPLGDDEDVAIDAWNLGSSALRRVAAAAAFVPLLSIAEPAFAAPPLSAPVMEPSPAPVVVDASIWEGLIDQLVVIQMKDGSTFRGTVLSVTNGVMVCARASDNLMVVVDPVQIETVNVEGLPGHPQPKKLPKGDGLIVMGSIATAIGGALSIATLVVGAVCIDNNSGYGYTYVCPYVTIPTGVVGVANLAAGIPMLVSGLRKRKAWRAAQEVPSVSAFVGPTRNGAMAGFGIRF